MYFLNLDRSAWYAFILYQNVYKFLIKVVYVYLVFFCIYNLKCLNAYKGSKTCFFFFNINMSVQCTIAILQRAYVTIKSPTFAVPLKSLLCPMISMHSVQFVHLLRSLLSFRYHLVECSMH